MEKEKEDQVIHNGDLIFTVLVKVLKKIDKSIDVMVEVRE